MGEFDYDYVAIDAKRLADAKDRREIRGMLSAFALTLAAFCLLVGLCNSNAERHRQGTAREMEIQSRTAIEKVEQCGKTDDPAACLRQLELSVACKDMADYNPEKGVECVKALTAPSRTPETTTP